MRHCCRPGGAAWWGEPKKAPDFQSGAIVENERCPRRPYLQNPAFHTGSVQPARIFRKHCSRLEHGDRIRSESLNLQFEARGRGVYLSLEPQFARTLNAKKHFNRQVITLLKSLINTMLVAAANIKSHTILFLLHLETI